MKNFTGKEQTAVSVDMSEVKGACLFDEPLARHTTFHMGGRVGVLTEPKDTEDLKWILKEARENGLSWRAIGRGSNILAMDTGLPDMVIKLDALNRLNTLSDGLSVYAGSGVSLARLIGFCVEHGLGGLEFLSGIPGLVGGSVKGNAGAMGRSVSDMLKEVYVMKENGEESTVAADDMSFGYRRSGISDDTIVTGAVFKVMPDDKEKILGIVKEYLKRRNDVFPKEPSAGCVFKNPASTSAGRLIDEAGLKGFAIGKSAVSHKHANVIINLGEVSGENGSDAYSLIQYIKQTVYNKFGVTLDLEIDIWGC